MITTSIGENFHNACVEFYNTLINEPYLPTLVHLWNEDFQKWTGQWWWMMEEVK